MMLPPLRKRDHPHAVKLTALVMLAVFVLIIVYIWGSNPDRVQQTRFCASNQYLSANGDCITPHRAATR